MEKKSDTPRLSVRKRRDYEQLLKERRNISQRVKAYQYMGTVDDKELLTKSAKEIGKVLKHLPENLMRKAMHLATVTFIPKSPRGRKPSMLISNMRPV
jgi:hypothetical protein